MAAKRSGATDQWRRLGGPDYEIVKVAAHLESIGLSDAADLHWLEPAVRINCSTCPRACSSSVA